MVEQEAIGIGDFILLDEITTQSVVDNLRVRWDKVRYTGGCIPIQKQSLFS